MRREPANKFNIMFLTAFSIVTGSAPFIVMCNDCCRDDSMPSLEMGLKRAKNVMKPAPNPNTTF